MSSLPRALPWSLAIAAMFSLGAEVRAGADSGNSACPQGAKLDPKRTQAVLRRVRSQPQGRRLLAARGRPVVVCYGDVPEGIVQLDDVITLQVDRAVTANAARLGHLLHHLVHGLPFDERTVRGGSLVCDELVSKADAAERAAHNLENLLRRAFRLPPLELADSSNSYRQRCEELRKPPTTPAAM